jgi:hypothetical protein
VENLGILAYVLALLLSCDGELILVMEVALLDITFQTLKPGNLNLLSCK